MPSLGCRILVGAFLLLAAAAPVHADVVTGTFTGSIGNEDDSGSLLGLFFASPGDAITGTFWFSTAAIIGGTGTNTLGISVTDTTVNENVGATDMADGSGLYGVGSGFAPTIGDYFMAASGGYDEFSTFAELEFISPGILAGVDGQGFTVSPGSGSHGLIEADFGNGLAASYMQFSISSATVTDVAIPELASLTVVGLGMLALMDIRRRKLPIAFD